MQEIHLFTPAMLNQFQLGYNRYHRENQSQQRFPDVAAKLAIPGADQNPSLVGFPVVSITGYAAIGEGTYNPLQFYNELEQLKDTFSYVRGSLASRRESIFFTYAISRLSLCIPEASSLSRVTPQGIRWQTSSWACR